MTTKVQATTLKVAGQRITVTSDKSLLHRLRALLRWARIREDFESAKQLEEVLVKLTGTKEQKRQDEFKQAMAEAIAAAQTVVAL